MASLFVTMLNCPVLGILRLSICKLDVVSVFFNLHVASKSPMLLWKRANLPCLVKLTLNIKPLMSLVILEKCITL